MKGSLSHAVPLLRAATCALCVLYGGSVAAQTGGANVRGRIADAAGTALVDFPVLVVDSGGRAVPLRTGRDGRFATVGLEAGHVTVRLDARGYGQLGVRCRVRSGQTAFVELFAARTSAAPATPLPPARCRIDPPTSDVYVLE